MKDGYSKVLAAESQLDHLLTELIAAVRVDERMSSIYTRKEISDIYRAIFKTVEKITYRA
jgi:hypothetical protein